MILTAGVAGVPFGGADVPSFYGENTDPTIMNAYLLGSFMPFSGPTVTSKTNCVNLGFLV